MLQEAIDVQQQAVEDLFALTPHKDEIFFKAPTGSGKTHMMADYMNRYLGSDPETVFIVSTLSKGNLAEQNYNNFKRYYDEHIFENLNTFLVSSETSSEERLFIPTDYSVYVLPRDLYKETSKLKRGVMTGFLEEIIKIKKKKIILIKDECHIKTSNLDELSRYFYKVINFSATPKLSRGQYPDVEITEQAAINSKLIKSVEFINEDGNTYEQLDKALDEFEILKEQYINSINIHPCFIIQISNKNKAEEEWTEIQNVLANSKHNDLTWMLIVNKNGAEDKMKCDTNDRVKISNIPVSKWKDIAKSNESNVDIIIFKMVISEGWDIPRACMLFQIRDTESAQLDEQVIGRVRRNPKLLDFENYDEELQNMMLKAKVWGIKPESGKKFRKVELQHGDIQKEVKVKTTKLKGLKKSSSFDIEKIIENHRSSTVPESIFDLYRRFNSATKEVQNEISSYVDSYDKWLKATSAIKDINEEAKKELCDYDSNLVLNEDDNGIVLSPIQKSSSFAETEYYKEIDNWVWKLKDYNSEKFSFDSEAEKLWADILSSLSTKDNPKRSGRLISGKEFSLLDEPIYLWGKNFPDNSLIKYEYYLNGIHSSYPDFVMIDWQERIHLFEVKSLNRTLFNQFNTEEYEEKIQALKECYKYTAKITGYHFWIPVMKGDDWHIFHYHNGNEDVINKNEFISFIKSET